jgi:phosphoglycolate phosphatase-like HAD superfamily hydrolase
MLILFDIDATLITTSRAGLAAMEDAGRERFGPAFSVESTEFAGRLDPLILADLLRDNGLEVTPASLAAMREGYRRHLPGRLRERRCAPCPGIPELLSALRDHGGAVLGLLTGNFAETGQIKLRACGIDPEQFAIRVWGDESPHPRPSRDHLPEIGLARYRERFGPIEPQRVTIIGDTPHDVGCARAHGCRSLGVGTGMHTPDVLRRAGADHALGDLSATDEVLRWLLPPPDTRRTRG